MWFSHRYGILRSIKVSGGAYMATIKDIAKKAGVAQGTVSNVLMVREM